MKIIIVSLVPGMCSVTIGSVDVLASLESFNMVGSLYLFIPDELQSLSKESYHKKNEIAMASHYKIVIKINFL
jgi:hypothetical protein